MPQIIGCPRCTMKLSVPEGSTGKPVKCPQCQAVFPIPATTSAPQPQPVGSGVASAPQPNPTPPSSQGAAPAPQPTPAAASAQGVATPTSCPACGSELLEGAIACMDCGYLLQSETDDSISDMEAPPALCPNPACGVANPPTESYCQRCGDPLPTAAGTMLQNRYRIEKLLAMGGFGAVYLATDTKNNNNPVAIKDMICADQEEFAIRLNFFRREAEILRALASIEIVPTVFDLIEQGQSAYLVMEFIRGKDLLKIMEENNDRPFPLDLVIEWGTHMCDVLQHMHSQSPPLVHRDMKPDNVMLLEDNSTIKMIDFGTARDLGKTQKERKAAKTRVYTEGYAPPEQIVGKPEPRSDLFALAGTLYHLATGKAPEGFYTSKELEAQLGDPNGGINPADRWFYELVKINLAEDINDRYFSAREIKQDLQKRQLTTQVSCASCQQVNPSRQPYCSKCAEPLTDPAAHCNSCGKSNRMGSRFCIYCGNRLR